MFARLKLLMAVVFALTACDTKTNPDEYKIPNDNEEALVSSDKYKILSDDSLGNIKRSVDVLLKERITENELKAIAQKIHGDCTTYERTFIVYYLPGMKIGAGAWATTHFDPNLKVQIFGFLPDEVEAVAMDSLESTSVIGVWLDESVGAAKYILFLRDEKYFIDREFKDGSRKKFEVTPADISEDKSKFLVPNSNYNEYYQILPNGNMGIFDDDGLIVVLIRQ
ncbi:MAG: hypothetical protein DHS20C05_09500 [Hyphococcus sp.]|nr:MAG: hypothetical protein DHS20C05_09500 [Marinicaulis sp.]